MFTQHSEYKWQFKEKETPVFSKLLRDIFLHVFFSMIDICLHKPSCVSCFLCSSSNICLTAFPASCRMLTAGVRAPHTHTENTFLTTQGKNLPEQQGHKKAKGLPQSHRWPWQNFQPEASSPFPCHVPLPTQLLRAWPKATQRPHEGGPGGKQRTQPFTRQATATACSAPGPHRRVPDIRSQHPRALRAPLGSPRPPPRRWRRGAPEAGSSRLSCRGTAATGGRGRHLAGRSGPGPGPALRFVPRPGGSPQAAELCPSPSCGAPLGRTAAMAGAGVGLVGELLTRPMYWAQTWRKQGDAAASGVPG